MKKYVLVMAAIMFGIFAMPIESAASPRFDKKHKHSKHHFQKDAIHPRNAMAYHQQDKIQAMKSIAKADGRISPKERAIIKYEQRNVAAIRHHKQGRRTCQARR